jgi:D-3-phosphoglycerate dehydrogenase
VVSGGFREIIVAILDGIIDTKDIYANTFIFNNEGYIIGSDTSNPLAQSQGKVAIIKQLKKL